mmetsp:Transcript_5937/g.24849  ORF Transcript_5937/g.24849 Transcript_5937/m.24849 type:complete len:1150 (-) Transcript_5937:411-3860(-)
MAASGATKVEQHWQIMQKRTFTRYMNSKLKGRGIEVTDLYEDLKSGIVLYNFLEVLTGESLKRHGKLNNGNLRIQRVANQNVVFKFFPEADIKLENIGVMDIVDGTPTPVLGLIWSIIAFYLVRELGESGDDLAAVKKKILKWAKKHAQKRVPIHNLTDSFADGRAFLAILNDVDNAGSPYQPADPRSNFRAAFADAEAKYGVPQMLDPDDENLWADEISMLTYLATMMDTLPDSVPQPDPEKLLDAYVDEHAPGVVDDELFALCKCKSYPSDRNGVDAAKAVARSMLEKSFGGPAAVDDAGDVLLASWDVAGPDAPTVLLYATTGLRGGGGGDWFAPSKDEESIVARGAKDDKANVAATVFAARALKEVLNGQEHAPFPPVNLKVAVGSLPPALAGPALLENPAVRAAVQAADYVVVAEAGGGEESCFGALDQSAAKAAALYGCRGYATTTVRCGLAASHADERAVSVAAHVGPLLDPALALSQKIGSLRDVATAAPSNGQRTIAGLPSLSSDLVEYRSCAAAKTTRAVVDALKNASGYSTTAVTAPEFGACTKGDGFAALALEPGLVVESLETSVTKHKVQTGARSYGRPVPCLPPTATATLRAYLPPGYDDLGSATQKTVLALEDSDAGGFGFEVAAVASGGQAGYLSDSRQPFLEVATAALGRHYDASSDDSEAIALAASPSYAPVPCAFSALNPDAGVFQIGAVPQRDRDFPAGGHESVRRADVVTHTKALARLLTTLHGVPKAAPKLQPYTVERSLESRAPLAVDAAARNSVVRVVSEEAILDKPPPPPPPPAPKKEEADPVVAAGEAPPAEAPVAAAEEAPPEEEERPPQRGPREAALPKEDHQEEFKEEEQGPLGPQIPAVEEDEPKTEPPTEEALIAELNALRADPSAYVPILEASLASYRDDKSFWPSEPGVQAFMTHEGAAAVEDAIAYLRKHAASSLHEPALRPLAMHDGMCRAARDHAEDLVRSGDRLGHTGSDGSKPADRLSRHGRWFERASECLAYRHVTPRMLVAQLVVDDGMPSRTQRGTALSSDMRAVGAAIVRHPSHGVLAVLTFAGGYGPPPLDHDALVATTPGQAVSADFKRVLDSIPVVAVHEQVEAALQRGDRVELNYQPGALKMTIWKADDDQSGQMYGVEWEKQ